jgi:hypothetical protein
MTQVPTFSVHVDVTNPGQFFACCGLLELAHRLWPGAEGWFDEGRFHVTCEFDGDGVPVSTIANAVSASSAQSVSVGGVDIRIAPVEIGPPLNLLLDWWLHQSRHRTPFKTWAANASSLQMYSKWLQPLQDILDDIHREPLRVLEVERRIQGSYGFDSSVGWRALDVGFSLNEHSQFKSLPLRPAVEILGAIGLQRFIPAHLERQDHVEYSVWHLPLNAVTAAPAAKRAVACPFVTTFRSTFVKRGSFRYLNTGTPIGGYR